VRLPLSIPAVDWNFRSFVQLTRPPALPTALGRVVRSALAARSAGLPPHILEKTMTLMLLAETAIATNPADMKLWAYVGFIGLVFVFLALDLGVFHREAHEVSMKESLMWSVVWLTCGLSFTGFVYFAYQHHWLGLGLDTAQYAAGAIVLGEVTGATAAVQYLTGYVVEKSLAMDNIFVIAMVFGFFAIPPKYQHRVLFWGIIGALIMRGGMIYLGAELIMRYTWILIVFGLFLLLTALKMALIESHEDPGNNPVVKLAKKFFRTVDFFDGQKFFTRRTVAPTYITDAKTGNQVCAPAEPGTLSAKWAITPLFLALIMVEITDLVFAVDSIPAIFAITPDPFIVFTSNIFAILGLRALYFCLAALIAKFRFLKPALILILAFVGVKLLLLAAPPYMNDIGLSAEEMKSIKIDPIVSLVIVVATLVVASVMSIMLPAKENSGKA
jgi:tellurite resistance protein TerC